MFRDQQDSRSSVPFQNQVFKQKAIDHVVNVPHVFPPKLWPFCFKHRRLSHHDENIIMTLRHWKKSKSRFAELFVSRCELQSITFTTLCKMHVFDLGIEYLELDKNSKKEISSVLASRKTHLSSIPGGCRNGCWTRWTRRRRGRRRGGLTTWWHAEALNGTRARIIAGRRSLQVQCVTPVRTSAKTKHATLRPIVKCSTGCSHCGVGHAESCCGRLAQ